MTTKKNLGIGARIRQWRKSRHIKGYELCKMLKHEDGHLSQGSLSDIENGKSLPSTPTIIAFIKHTDINVFWMLTGMEYAIDDGEIPAEPPKVTLEVLPGQEVIIPPILKIKVLPGQQLLIKGME